MLQICYSFVVSCFNLDMWLTAAFAYSIGLQLFIY